MKEQQIGWIINETATVKDIDRIKPKIYKENGHTVAETVLQEAEEKNRNGRWYGGEEFFNAILPETCPRTKELLRSGTLRGESGHPDSKELNRQAKIEKSNCSVLYLNIWRDGNRVMGKYRGTNNELGKEVEQDLDEGFLQAFSLRALGSVVNTARGAEVKGIKFITYDEVIYPSHPRAYTKGINGNINESTLADDAVSKEAIREADIEYIKNDKGLLIPISNSNVINFIKQESVSFNVIKESFDIFYDTITITENGRNVRLSDMNGNVFIIPIEDHIHREIMESVSKF